MRLCLPYVSAVLLLVWLGGCTTTAQPMRMIGEPTDITGSIKSYNDLVRSFDGALTEAEKRAVISGLQQDGERQAKP